MLVLLYYLSQNPDFAESVKPLMGQLKNSQQMLNFLNDLSKFNETFSTIKKQTPNAEQGQDGDKKEGHTEPKKEDDKRETAQENADKEKTPQSPTAGIADDFIQQILESYLKK